MKKIISILILCVFFISACGQAEGIIDEAEDNTPKIDMDGYVCKILQELPVENPFTYTETTVFADTMLDRIAQIEKTFNCDIVLSNEGDSDQDLLRYVMANMAAAVDIGEMIFSSNSNMGANFAYAGYLYPLTELKDILDYENSEKYGGSNILELTMYENVPYKVHPMMLPEQLSKSIVMSIFIINEKHIKKYNLTDPREFVENKTWTWDTFEKILPDFHIKDGETDIKASWIGSYDFIKRAAMSNGIKFIDLIDGVVQTDIYSDKNIKAIDWAKKIYDEYRDDLMWENYDWTRCRGPFINGETIMTLTSTVVVLESVATKLDDFGVIPFPCGPDGVYGNWSADVLAAPGMSIFINAQEPEYAAHITERLFEPFEELETREKLIDYSMRSTFFDRRDAELMMDMIDFARYNYWTVGGDDFWTSASSSIKKNTGAQTVATHGKKVELLVEKYISTNYEYMSTHPFGKN